MATKGVKYPGKLGKLVPEREISAAVIEAMLGAQGGGSEAKNAAVYEWIYRRELELLFALLDHYAIAPDDEDRWFRLAQKLASAHVPAFRIASPVGRPRKLSPLGSLADLASSLQSRPKGKPGRKRKYTDGNYRQLLKSVRETCAEKGFKGRGAVTRALTELISNDARKRGKSVTQALRGDLDFFRRQHSEAKKKFPELA